MQRAVKHRGQDEVPDGEKSRRLRHSVAEQSEGAFSHAVEDARALGGDVALNRLDQSGREERSHQHERKRLQPNVTRQLLHRRTGKGMRGGEMEKGMREGRWRREWSIGEGEIGKGGWA